MVIGGTIPMRWAKKMVGVFPSLLAWLLPCSVVVAVKGSDLDAPLLSLLRHPSLPDSVSALTTTFALITSSFDIGSRTILLPFDNKTPAPLATLKIAGHPALNSYTQQEQKTLTHLHKILSTSLATIIPTPLGGLVVNDRAVSVESHAKGQSLWVSLHETKSLNQHIHWLMGVTQWVAEFHYATEQKPRIDGTVFRDEWLLPLWNRYTYLFQLEAEITLFDRTMLYLASISDTLPLVWQHFDYSPWNIYHHGDHLTVIDWEVGRATPYGPAGGDVLYFIKYWLHAVLRTKGDDAESQAFHFLRHHLSPAIYTACQQAIQRYADILKMDRRWFSVLMVYGWMEQAVHQAERQQQLMSPSVPTTPKAVHYLRALNRHADALFAD